MHDMVLKLDDLGQPAWLAVMILSFILFWPLGLAVLAFLLWSGRMGCGWHGDKRKWKQRWQGAWDGSGSGPARSYRPTGNRAFDEYREETLKRLEEESREFQSFLERLRLAKDRSEFDQFMAERKARPADDASGATPSAS